MTSQADQWWSNSAGGQSAYAVCLIPGPLVAYPYGISYYQVCGGQGAVNMRPLQDASGNVWGSYYLYRDYQNAFWVTVTLDGTAALQVAERLGLE